MTLSCRSVAEAHLFMDLRGCAPGRRGHRLERRGEDLVSVYSARRGDEVLHFEFRVLGDPLTVMGFGGDEPSPIIGPGEFHQHAMALSSGVPGAPAGLSADEVRVCKVALLRAAACLREVMKFIPEGESRVPEEVFRSVHGRRAFRSMPGQFDRRRLEAVASVYERMAADFAAAG